MKNKKVTVFLLLAVISIWSWIVYKLHLDMSVQNEGYKFGYTKPIKDKKDEFEYTLHSYVRDPFTSIIEDTSQYTSDRINDNIQKPVSVKEHIKEELPEFCGLIQNDDKKKTAILKIKGSFFFLSEKEKLNNYTVLKINDTNIVVQNKKHKVFISLSDDFGSHNLEKFTTKAVD